MPCILKTTHCGTILSQGDGSKWTETLNRLRKGKQTNDDIELLKTRCITKLSKDYPHDACHQFYTNKEVNEHNCLNLNRIKATLYSIDFKGDYPKNYKPIKRAQLTTVSN